jgi:hypothetical protein
MKKEEENKRKKQDDEEKKQRLKKEYEEKHKKLIKVRPLGERKGQAIANGKLQLYYDWSTSPAPSFVNNEPWKI